MKFALSILSTLLFTFSATSQCEGGRYRNKIFSYINVTSDVVYGSNYDLSGDLQELTLDVYTPLGDTETNRPLIVFAHGGSFVAGSKNGEDVVPLCKDLCKMGYVVASINYRLGIPITLDLEVPATEAVVRGYHDMKAAIRFFRKDVAESENTWNINPDEIYAAGSSAGGFITLHLAYMDEIEEIPSFLDMSQLGLTGGLEGDSGNAGYSSEVNGIINIAGALGDTTWMKPGDEPVCLFHGTGDNTVPFGSDLLYLFDTFEVMEVDGSNSVNIKADELGLTHCFEIYWMQGHVPHVSNPAYYDTTLSIMSNFLSHLVCPQIDLDCEYREIITSIDEADSSIPPSIQLFPNPAATEIKIRSTASLIGSNFEIFNLMGQSVYLGKLQNTEQLISLDGWPSGMYQLLIHGTATRAAFVKM